MSGLSLIGRCESCERMAVMYETEPDWSGEVFMVCRDCCEVEENE